MNGCNIGIRIILHLQLRWVHANVRFYRADECLTSGDTMFYHKTTKLVAQNLRGTYTPDMRIKRCSDGRVIDLGLITQNMEFTDIQINLFDCRLTRTIIMRDIKAQ